MNVIVANQYKDVLSNLNIDVIKKMDGVFDIDVITDTFANFYYNRMILDITAIKDYLNIATMQKLSTSLDASKIILFLSEDPRITNNYLSKIISLGIYNFTRDLSGVTYLMDNPNSYRDVAQYHNLAASDNNTLQEAKNNIFANNRNITNNNDVINSDINGNSNYVQQQFVPNNNVQPDVQTTRVIGIKNLTEHAGATTLTYILKKQLCNICKTLAVEVNANDFPLFNDSELLSVTEQNFASTKLKFSQFNVVLIDMNNAKVEDACTDIIYLLEPSTIKLNKLLQRDRNVLDKIKDKTIILNKSLLSSSDVKEFEYEAKAKIFYNMPPLDERQDNIHTVYNFLGMLGLYNGNSSKNSGLFDIFKK